MNGWIDVRERLPDAESQCLIWDGGVTEYAVYSAHWTRDGKCYFCTKDADDMSPTGGVTHWMPLPAGPPRDATPYEANV